MWASCLHALLRYFPYPAVDRALSPLEVQIVLRLLDRVNATPDHKLAIRLLLLTLLRKSELSKGMWVEVNFR
jgi:integrase